jgi:hypothetical protein
LQQFVTLGEAVALVGSYSVSAGHFAAKLMPGLVTGSTLAHVAGCKTAAWGRNMLAYVKLFVGSYRINFCNCYRKRLLVNSSRLFRHLAYINIPIIQTQAPSWCQHGWFLPLKHQGCTQHRLRQATMHSITPSKFHCLHSLHARPAELTTQQFSSFGGDFMAWAGLYCMLMGHENWNNPGMFTGATFPQVLLCSM